MSKWSTRLLKSKAFTRYLLLTNVVSGVMVDASGDYIVQKAIERSSPYDYPRTGRMAAVGVYLTVPDHYWYKLLDRRFPGRTPKTVTLKVLLDCAIMGPVNIVLFYLGERDVDTAAHHEEHMHTHTHTHTHIHMHAHTHTHD